jgi:ornithine cyclodeaminase/alanine dehydrogenase-like protein (mu-crystallin family)
MHLPMDRGGFHAKGASISLDRDYAAVKVNGNFPDNPAECGLPTIQGAIILCDGRDGRLLAILDSTEVTMRRTAAASALAARSLARPDSDTLLICGCGEQGRAHVTALRQVALKRLLVWDRHRQAAEALAGDLDGKVADDLTNASLAADVIACCTSAREPYLDLGMVKPGTFIAAVGADHPDKNELAPRLMAAAKVVPDALAQCAEMGELHHTLKAAAVADANIPELAQLLAGTAPGRASPEEIIVFDSTGLGTQDVAAAAAIYERCIAEGLSRPVALGRP